jgi:hypothetical protein
VGRAIVDLSQAQAKRELRDGPSPVDRGHPGPSTISS